MNKPAGGQGFGVVAQTYDNVRPSYPVAAVDWAFEGIQMAVDVVDLGAGTGKLTSQLAALGHRVQAVEPDSQMLRVLTEKLPTVKGTVGTGEATTLPDHSVDVVTVAQAFHWMDEAASFAEFRRILRPGGRVVLIWNDRDSTRSSWNKTLSAMLQSIGENTTAHRMTGVAPTTVTGFSTVETFRIEWSRTTTPEGLLDLVRSRSYIIALDETRRNDFLQQVRTLIDTHPDLAGKSEFDLPYLTSAFRYERT
jgi:ubiquinone/menaquinone biosynthesis C-methylase UbiE